MMDKKYNHASAERDAAAQWEKEQTYSAAHNPGPLYSIDTPPPTVSGSLHIGHIFSYTQTDIVARYKRMNGFSVFYPFGFDDNGLPTERYVEKKCDVRAHELGRSAFIALCLEQTQEAEIEFKNLWQRMGLSVDWNHWYSTISERTRRISQLSFIKLYNDGFIYRQDEPALYCTVCRTSVAQAELDDKEKPSLFNDIVFKDLKGNELVISTTRPELLSSTVALAVHPSDTRFTHLHNTKAIVPIYNREVPILVDDMVDPEKGTGIVMISTFGDQKDVLWFKKLQLPLLLSIGRDGKWLPHTGIIAGMKANEARTKILEELKNQNLLLKQTPITHTVNVHERCKNEIEYSVLAQWFINILDHKDQFIKCADEITWYPAFMKTRYVNWVENIKWNWCISRQRLFGIPFPVWHCVTCKHIITADPKDLPIDPQETSYKGSCPSCKGTEIIADTDVMDTWNTSSITPYICYDLMMQPEDPFDAKALEFLPMGMRPQAHDIIRTWAFYTIIKSWMHNKTIPWNEIVISGHVLSDQKEKLSKSKDNNRLAPNTLLDTYSADVIRFWTASGNLGHDIMFSEQQLKIGHRLVTKLWNSFLFNEQHISDFVPNQQPADLGLVNEWILDSATRTFESYKKHLDKAEFGLALSAIEPFFWNDVCDNYLELIKNQLFNPAEYDPESVAATKWTLYHLGLRILQFYAPYLPYVTETIYQNLYKKTINIDSIHQTKFESLQAYYSFEGSRAVMNHVLTIVAGVRKLKSEQQLSLKVPISTLTVYGQDTTLFDALTKHEQLLKGVIHAGHIVYKKEALESPVLKQVSENVYEAHISL